MNRTAFVTGANKGIGFEIARQLGEAGWKVLLGARSIERGEAAASELRNQGLNAEFVQIDMTDKESIEEAAGSIRANYADLTLLIEHFAII